MRHSTLTSMIVIHKKLQPKLQRIVIIIIIDIA